MKILHNLCLHFARQDGKNRKENHATKVTKTPKTKIRKHGMIKTKNLNQYHCTEICVGKILRTS